MRIKSKTKWYIERAVDWFCIEACRDLLPPHPKLVSYNSHVTGIGYQFRGVGGDQQNPLTKLIKVRYSRIRRVFSLTMLS